MSYIEKKFRGIDYKFVNTKTAPALIEEIFSDNYKVLESGIEFRPGDIVLDLGANEGIFSIFLAKLFPDIQIYAYEPVTRTFEALGENVKINNVTNVTGHQLGVGGPEHSIASMVVSNDYSGGSSQWCEFNGADHYIETVHTTTLFKIFAQHNIERCRLLKIDVEGAEYDALYNATNVLHLVDYAAMEVHINKRLEFLGRRPEGLITWMNNQTNVISASFCKMAE